MIKLMMRLRNLLPFHPYIPFILNSVHTQPSFHSTLPGSVSALFLIFYLFMDISNIQNTATRCKAPARSRNATQSHDVRDLLNAEKQTHRGYTSANKTRQSAGFDAKLAFTSTAFLWNRDVPKYVIDLPDTDFRVRIVARVWVSSEQSPDSVNRSSRLVSVTRGFLYLVMLSSDRGWGLELRIEWSFVMVRGLSRV